VYFIETTHIYGAIEQCKVDDQPQDGRHLQEGDERVYSCNILQLSMRVKHVAYVTSKNP
jgi:hypothetical protein